jgi:hypothetical protein
MLTSCGPTLFSVGGILNITAGDIVTIPLKKKIIEEVTKKPSKTADN